MEELSPVKKFSYLPLQSSSGIRLIRILPSEDAKIECQMSNTSLDNLPLYSALSYVWGTPKRTCQIIVNNRIFLVTENLFLALQHLHYQKKPRTWWIDAICINQLDDKERSSQIRVMKDIYSKAEEIVIWLGTEENDSALAVELAAQVHRYWFHQTQTLGKAERTVISTPRKDLVSGISLYGDTQGSRALQAFSALLSRPWWERIWIVQEATTPFNTKIVQCGNSLVRWDALIAATRFILALSARADLKDDFADLAPIDHFGSRRIFNLENLRNSGQYSSNLLTTLADFRHFKASDPRDMVYALLDLLDEEVVEALAPDYTLPVAQAYENAAKYCILKCRSLDCLGYCSSLSDQIPGLPSWCPDWSNQGDGHPLAKLTYRRSQKSHAPPILPVYNATGGLKAPIALQSSLFSISNHKIMLRGFHIDTLQSVGKPWHQADVHPQSSPVLPNLFPSSLAQSSSCLLAIPSPIYVPTGEPLPLAYAHTLVCDVSKERNVRHRPFHLDLAYWLTVTDLSMPPADHERRRVEWGSLLFALVGRRMVCSGKGYVGLGPARAIVGDWVCALIGGSVLYVLRPVGDGKVFRFVGEGYVHGLMDGEGVSGKERTFVVI